MEQELYKFNPKILGKKRASGHSPICILLGARGSGKSVNCLNIISELGLKMMICMSGTEEGNGFYSSHIHPLFVYNKFEPEVLARLVKHQKKVALKLKEEGTDLKHVPDKGVGLIIDDLAYDKTVLKNEYVREIFFNGRHLGITLIMTFQYMMDIPPAFRSNIDYVIVCKENKKDNLDRLYKYFFSVFDKPADFKKVLSQCTVDFGCLVLDNTTRSSNLEDQVFWYKGELGKKFKVNAHMWPIWDDILKQNKGKQITGVNSLTVVKKGVKDVS